MKKIVTESYRRTIKASWPDTRIPISLDSVPLPSGIFAHVEGYAYISQPTQEPASTDIIDPPYTSGGDFAEHGEYTIDLYDGTGEPLKPDGSPNLKQYSFQLSDLQPNDMNAAIAAIQNEAERSGLYTSPEKGNYVDPDAR